MAPFRLGHDELQHELPWRLMQNGPVTMYRRAEQLEREADELGRRGFELRRFDCSRWANAAVMHSELRQVLELPEHTGTNFDALRDSLTDMDVPDRGGVAIVLENFAGGERDETLIDVLAGASRMLRTEDATYVGPRCLGAAPPRWNDREWLNANRGLP